MTFGQITVGPDIPTLKVQIAEKLGVADVLLCASGSFALELALRGCGVSEGDEVVLPAFCCTAVVAPVIAVGATPVLADIGADLNVTADAVNAVLTKKTRAIIVPHLFGNPAPIDAIVAFAAARNIRVIDDAAQALGATVSGRAAGSCGAAGIISFGRGKVCSGLGGGVLVFRQKEAAARCAQLRPSAPALIATVKNVFSSIARRRSRRWAAATMGILSGEAAKDPNEPTEPYPRESMANVAAAVAASLVQSLETNLAARWTRVRAYRELLGRAPEVELIPHGPGSACLTQVIRLERRRQGDDRAAALVKCLRRAGYEVQGSYVPIHLLPRFDRCVWDRLPYTERVWPDLVELPCEPGLSLSDVERIAAIVKQVASGR